MFTLFEFRGDQTRRVVHAWAQSSPGVGGESRVFRFFTGFVRAAAVVSAGADREPLLARSFRVLLPLQSLHDVQLPLSQQLELFRCLCAQSHACWDAYDCCASAWKAQSSATHALSGLVATSAGIAARARLGEVGAGVKGGASIGAGAAIGAGVGQDPAAGAVMRLVARFSFATSRLRAMRYATSFPISRRGWLACALSLSASRCHSMRCTFLFALVMLLDIAIGSKVGQASRRDPAKASVCFPCVCVLEGARFRQV